MADKRPAIGSDEWFYWLIQQINGGDGTALTDEAMAAIVDRANSHTRASIVALYMAGDASTLTDAKTYADAVQLAAVNTAKTYADNADVATLAEASRRIASAVSGVSVPLQNYADGKDAAVRSAAFAQAATEGANAKDAAKAYTDQKTAGIAKAISDGDAATLAAAKQYADSAGAGGSFDAIRDYVDAADGQVRYDLQRFAADAGAAVLDQARADASTKAGQALTDAKAYVDGRALVTPQAVAEGDAATLASAKQYADTVGTDTLSQAQIAATNADGDNLVAAKAYADDRVDTVVDGIFVGVDGKVEAGVTEANTYTDNTVSGALTTVGNTYATKAYTDQQNVAAKTYTDTRETAIRSAFANADTAAVSAAVAQAKTYTDGVVPTDSLWVDLSSAVVPGTYNGTANVAYRKVGKRVTLRGQIARKDGANMGAEGTMLTLPAGIRPTQVWPGIGVGASSTFAKVIVNADGTITMSAPTSATTYIRLDGISFYVD